MLKILVADDHAVVRRGIVQILKEDLPISELGEAQNVDELLALTWRGEWDIIILDLTMPGRSGLEALAELKAQRPLLPVLILSMHPEDQIAMRLLKAGASGYLTKDSAPTDLVKAVRKILGGGRYVSERMADMLVDDLQQTAEKPLHECLSDREYEVMRMLVNGRTVTEIARDLLLSVKTVSTYHMRILEKMKMKTDSELVQYAVRHNLVGP